MAQQTGQKAVALWVPLELWHFYDYRPGVRFPFENAIGKNLTLEEVEAVVVEMIQRAVSKLQPGEMLRVSFESRIPPAQGRQEGHGKDDSHREG